MSELVDAETLAVPRPGSQNAGDLALALDEMTQGLCTLDEHGRILFCNRQFMTIFAISRCRPGLSIVELIGGSGPATGGDGVAHLDHARLTASRIPAVLRHGLPDGRTLCITHAPLKSGGAIQLYEDMTDRLKEEVRVRQLSQIDALTGLENRTAFRADLARTVAASHAANLGALLILDLDDFKQVNDTLGHAVGDRLLQGVVIRIKRLLRASDAFYRLGGDEFAIILSPTASGDDVMKLAMRINNGMEHPFRLDGHQVYAGISIGIAVFGERKPGDDHTSQLRHADIAMYHAKAAGKNTSRVFQECMETQLRERKALQRDLNDAMALNQLSLWYQPQVDLHSGELCGVEALLRWHHPERGHVPPADFIPVAEEIGLIVPLGEWVLRTACAQAAAWPDLAMAVNVSPAQLRDPKFSDLLDQILIETGLQPERLEVEITEGVLLNQTDRVIATLRRLIDRGVKIALDDFGTGYSNIAYLQQFSWNKLKIDRSFVKSLGEDAASAAIVEAVLALGHGLGVRVIAEGVETRQQLKLLAQAGCDEAQGYLLGKPMRSSDIDALLSAWHDIRLRLF